MRQLNQINTMRTWQEQTNMGIETQEGKLGKGEHMGIKTSQGQPVMNLVATHSNCTSPMDYISHHALHSHIPVHHYTHHTAVTIHSLVLIVSPHLHLIHSHTFKQHSHMHSLRSLVLPWLTFPSVFPCALLPGPLTLSPDRLLPALLTPPAYWLSSLSAACPDPLLCLCLRICLIYVALDTTVWYLPVWPPLCINKAADGSQRHWPVLTQPMGVT